jgi:phospholipase/carboxylesterase
MSDLPQLSGPMLPPANGGDPARIVVFAHGVGANGDDLIGLAPFFQQVLPDALFVSPNAPFPYDMAPQGYQWFSLGDFSQESRLAGAQATAPILDAYLDEQLAEYGLTESDMALIGFSQGTMMALHVGLRRERQLAAIVGYSGMLVGDTVLKDEIKSLPPVMLVHGQDDPLLPIDCLAHAKTNLDSLGFDVEAHVRPGLAHGIDEPGIRLGMDFLMRAFGGDA